MQRITWSAHWMLVFVPIAFAVEHWTDASAPVKFLVAALAIIPVARLIGHSTENLAHYTGDSIGALLNAVFGNLPELIICVVALQAGLHSMVAASLVGAILFNLLLVLGLSFLLGGLRHHTLEFNAKAVRVYSTMMFIAVVSLALPSIYERAFAPSGVTIEQEKINIGLGTLLLVIYGLYLVYLIVTHPEEFASAGKAEDTGHHERWSLPVCIGMLVGSWCSRPCSAKYSSAPYKGVQLIAVYLMVALLLYFVPL
jgi:Ca2+:H+ antiporter